MKAIIPATVILATKKTVDAKVFHRKTEIW